MQFNPLNNHRILLVDDDPAIHEDLRKLLRVPRERPDNFDKIEAALFEEASTESRIPDRNCCKRLPTFEIDSAYRGEEGLELIEKSLAEDRPYAMAFVDVRMSPGWDGVETTRKIWQRYPDLQVVLCTAFSDRSWEEMVRPLGYLDRVIVLKKPFDDIEVLQLAVALTEKWQLNQMSKLRLDNLEKLVQMRV